MSRLLLSSVVLIGLAAPIAAGVYALSSGSLSSADGSIDDQIVEQAVSAPLELAPLAHTSPDVPPVSSLADLAEQDPAGAVALVRQALMNDPAMLEEAIAQLEVLRASQEDDLISQIILDNADQLFSDEFASVMGNPDGAITLVEFLDYNCGFCKRAHDDVVRLIAEHEDVRVLVKDFPVLGPGSLEAAQVAIAYRAIGGDMEAFIDTMMREESAQASLAMARGVALELGASAVALDLALDSPQLMQPVAIAYELAEQLNIRGTPAFVVGDQRLIGAVGFERLVEAIQVERERQAAL
jgi:protein-disulfide isomerase